MRRLLSMLLFAVILLPQVAAMLSSGASAEAGLPACCRRNGAHHCGSMMAPKADPSQTRIGTPVDKCPFQQRALGSTHHELSTGNITTANVVALRREPAAAAKAECLRRISFDRSRQKRGPPAELS